MAQRCGVCAHPRRAEIDEILRGRHSASSVARDLGVTRFSVQRHRERHLTPESRTAVLGVLDDQKSCSDPSRTETPEGGNSEIKKSCSAVLTTSSARTEYRNENEPRPRGARVDPQTAFLTSYAANGDVAKALKAGAVTRAQLRKWQETDEAFSLRFHIAEAEAIELLEVEARTRAVAGSQLTRRVYRHGVLYEEIHEWRPSDAMLTKLLQAHKPEKYGDKLTVTQTTVVKAIDADAWNSV